MVYPVIVHMQICYLNIFFTLRERERERERERDDLGE